MRITGFLVNVFAAAGLLSSVAPLLSHADQILILDPTKWEFLGTSPSPSTLPDPSQQYLIYSYAQFSSLVQGYFSFSVQSPVPPSFSPTGIRVFLPSNARVGTMNESYLSLGGAESITITANTLMGLECGYIVSGDGNNFPSNFIQIPSAPYTFNIPFSKDLYAQFACRNSGSSDITMSITSIKYTLPIQPKYKLMASVKNAEIVANGPPLLVRVEPSNLHVCNDKIQPDIDIKSVHVECKDDKGNSINGCQFRIVGNFPSDANDGGHDRSNHPSRPTQLFAEAFPMSFVPIDVTGTDFSYKVPDASGEVDLRVLGKGPNGEDLDPFVIRVRVQTPGLVPINVANLGFINLDTHAAGKYGTSALNTALVDMVTNFRGALAKAKVLPQNMPSLKSEGANLPWGGLFDIGEDHLTPGWSEPHCGHRGNNIDITVSDLSEPEKDLLADAISEANLTTPYQPESPGFNDSHWHLQK